MTSTLQPVRRVCAAALALMVALTGLIVTPSAAQAEGVAPPLDAGSSYTVSVDIHDARDPSEPSMAAGMLAKDAEIDVDGSGQARITLHFVPTQIMGLDVHANGLGVYQEGSQSNFIEGVSFKLGEDNSAICQFVLPYLPNDGMYRVEMRSDIMDRDALLYVKWPTLKKTGGLSDTLAGLVERAKKYSANDYTEESFGKLKAAIDDAEAVLAASDPTPAQMQAAIDAINNAVQGLNAAAKSPFEAGQTYYVDVTDQDPAGSRALDLEARFDVDEAGVIKATLRFNPYSDFLGAYRVTSATILDREGAPAANNAVEPHDDGGATWTFDLPYFASTGLYKAKVTATSASPDKVHTLAFDWSTIRTTADFRKLAAAIEKASGFTASGYTASSFAALSEALARAKDVAADTSHSQATVNDALAALNEAMSKLLGAENAGSGNTVNLGASGFNAPFADESAPAKPWAGSRVYFGWDDQHKPISWRVLQTSEDGILLNSEHTVTGQAWNTDASIPASELFWNTSTLRAYLNGEWFNKTFRWVNQDAVKPTKVKSLSLLDASKEVAPATQDKVFALSMQDYRNKAYGFVSDESRAAKDVSLMTRTTDESMPFMTMVLIVLSDGDVDSGFNQMMPSSSDLGVQPSITLDPSRILMSTPASAAVPTGIQKPLATEDNTWKLTMLYDSWKLDVNDVRSDGGKISVDYAHGFSDSGRTSRSIVTNWDNHVVSALAVRNGDWRTGTPIGYGAVGDISGESGSVSFELPADFNKATDKLYLFAEQIGEGADSNLATTPVEVSIPNAEEPPAPEPSDPAVPGEDVPGNSDVPDKPVPSNPGNSDVSDKPVPSNPGASGASGSSSAASGDQGQASGSTDATKASVAKADSRAVTQAIPKTGDAASSAVAFAGIAGAAAALSLIAARAHRRRLEG